MSQRNPPQPPVSFIAADRLPWDAPQRMPGGPSMRKPMVDLNGQPVSPDQSVPTAAIGDQWHSARIVSGQALVPNLASVKFLDIPPERRNLLMFRNYSANANVYIEFGRDASDDSVIRLTPNTMMLFDVVVPQDDVYAFGDAANAILSYAYSNTKY
jgi:hypothetical protein